MVHMVLTLDTFGQTIAFSVSSSAVVYSSMVVSNPRTQALNKKISTEGHGEMSGFLFEVGSVNDFYLLFAIF